MSKQYDVDDILNEIKAKKRARTLLSLPAPDEALPPHVPNRSAKTSRTFPPKHTGSLNRSL